MQKEVRIYLKDVQIIWTMPLSQKLASELTIKSFKNVYRSRSTIQDFFLLAFQFPFERFLRFSFVIKRLSILPVVLNLRLTFW